jgi:hypothetical protein
MKTKNDQIQLNDLLSYTIWMIFIKDMNQQLISYGSAFLIPFLVWSTLSVMPSQKILLHDALWSA